MRFNTSEYNLLPSETIHQDQYTKSYDGKQTRYSHRYLLLCVTAFIISAICNMTFLARIIHQSSKIEKLSGSMTTRYANLVRDIPKPYHHASPFYKPNNSTQEDMAWQALDESIGMVALSDQYVAATGLPKSQRFPWDQKKGIYLLTAYHNVHCIKIVRQSLVEFSRGLPQTWLFDHVTHCLDGLLQTIQCEADDTPRYTTLDESPVSGNGQMRNCRSWDKMERWAIENSACYRFVHPTHGDYPRVNRYRFCPEGSPYIESVRKYLADNLEVEEFEPESWISPMIPNR